MRSRRSALESIRRPRRATTSAPKGAPSIPGVPAPVLAPLRILAMDDEPEVLDRLVHAMARAVPDRVHAP
jgi:hypothetical protein